MSLVTTHIIKDTQNNVYTLDISNESGAGGEGRVYEVDDKRKGKKGSRAVKVLHEHILSNPLMYTERYNKIQDQLTMVAKLPPQVVAPNELAFKQDNTFGGFFMNYVDIDRYDILYVWSKDTHKANEGITFEDIISVFVELIGIVAAVWLAGFVFGDLNPRGILVLKKQYWTDANKGDRLRIVDADSMQFKKYLCPVYTMNYVDRLEAHKINWNTRPETLLDPTFMSKKTDAFIVSSMLFETVTGHNFYDGWHTFLSGRKPFLKNGFHVLHKEVDYPDGGVDFDQLPEPLQKHFEAVLLKDDRTLIEKQTLLRAINVIVDLAPRQSQPTVSDGKFVLNRVINKLGTILDFQVKGDYVYLLHVIGKDKLFTVVDVKWFKVLKQIDLSDNLSANLVSDAKILDANWLVFGANTKHNVGSRCIVTLYDTNANKGFEVSTYAGYNRKAIVAGGGGYVFVARRGQIYSAFINEASNSNSFTKLVNSSEYAELKSDRNTGEFVQRIMTGTVASYRVTRGKSNLVVYPQELRQGETVEEWTVKFNNSHMLLIRETKFQGQINTRLDEFYVTNSKKDDNGRLLADVDREISIGRIIDEQIVSDLDEIGYANGTIVYGTANGIKREEVNSGTQNLFDKTRGFTPTGSSILMYGRGLISIGNGTIATIS